MSLISDIHQNIKVLMMTLDRYFKWTADSPWKRLFTLMLFAVFFLAIFYFFPNNLVNKMEKRSEDYQIESRYLNDEIRYKIAIDWIEVCQKHLKMNSSKSPLYCDEALEHYKNSNKRSEVHIKKLTKILAYDAMIIDLKSDIRRIESKRLLLSSKSPEYKVLTLLLSTTTIIILSFLMLLITGGLLFVMYKYSKKYGGNV
jgi:hypothetical protein